MELSQLTKIPKVLGAGLSTLDGFIIDSQFIHGYEPEKFGAMSAKIINQIKKIFGKEKISVILYTDNIVFLARLKDEQVLFLIAEKDANLGLIKIKFEKM
ncbi:MAG: hypothetical protein N3A65_03935 [candidate division WOR-3 bacterium]|nr:hypothetical protein [candidate division WOR-3 bacterium]